MVATGQTTKKRSVIPTEIIDVSNPTKSCVLDDKIIDQYQYGSTGGMLGTTPVICGGQGHGAGVDSMSNKCLLYGTSQKINLNFKRSIHSSVSLNNSMLWVMGGFIYNPLSQYGRVHVTSSTEFVTREGAVNGPTLMMGANVGHCPVLFPGNSNVYLIGGGTSNGTKVWVANPSNGFTFTQGPSLMSGRYNHACGTMSIGTKSIIVAAGGHNLASVEILDPLSNQWVAGN